MVYLLVTGMQALWHDSLLIRFLILALYILFACLSCVLPHLSFSFHFSIFIFSLILAL